MSKIARVENHAGLRVRNGAWGDGIRGLALGLQLGLPCSLGCAFGFDLRHGFLLLCHTHSVVFPHSQAPYAARLHVDFRALPICHLQIAGLENAVQHLLIHQAPPLRYSEIVREKRVTPY